MSATFEDIFWAYETNRILTFNMCSNIGTCPMLLNNTCACALTRPVIPHTIGSSLYSPPSLTNLKKVKSYIVPGELCTICLDPILVKSSAYITICGHGFHKNCIIRAYESKVTRSDSSDFDCPLCRCYLGCDVEFIGDRYNTRRGTLDYLENFWWKFDTMMPALCDKTTSATHHPIGMDKTCQSCLKYRATGLD